MRRWESGGGPCLVLLHLMCCPYVRFFAHKKPNRAVCPTCKEETHVAQHCLCPDLALVCFVGPRKGALSTPVSFVVARVG